MKSLLSILLLCSACCLAQQQPTAPSFELRSEQSSFFMAVNGVPLSKNPSAVLVQGTPYFQEDWMKGTVIMSQGKEYQNLKLKLNLLRSELHFQDDKGQEMVCATPLRLVKLWEVSGKTYQFAHSTFVTGFEETKHAWLELLADGPVKLYVNHKKSMSESTPYGSAGVEQRIFTTPVTYLWINDKMVRVKKLQDIADALPEKKPEVQQWMRTNQEKNQAGMIKLVEYYNSLAKG